MSFIFHGDDICQATLPSPISNPYWVAFSPSACQEIQFEVGNNGFPVDPEWLNLLSGNALSASKYQFNNPIATVYSGHQFGVWAGQLGDGRAILLGELEGQELQLKGAGITKYSRMGDGRAVLRSAIREFLCSEAMYVLGIPTTRALSVVGSKMSVRRETLETAAVCARLAPSFIRVGHFEHFASLQDISRLQEIANYLITSHYPECQTHSVPYLELFKQISKRNAQLVARWQSVGFCHGVLNSDNISVLGLTLDYGPFGFLDHFELNHICNHSDQGGRYAYSRQPQIMHWNMACLASAFVPLIELSGDREKARSMLQEGLEDFPATYTDAWQTLFRQKLGLTTTQEDDIQLIERLLQAMHDSRVDFTSFFRKLGDIKIDQKLEEISIRDDFIDRSTIDRWFMEYFDRLKAESSIDATRRAAMNLVNPKFILRNHLAQAAIDKAKEDDFSEIKTLLQILQKPYAEQIAYEAYAAPPAPHLQRVEVSCSS